MNATAWQWRVWSGARPVDRLLRALLRPPSWIYGAGVRLRSTLYDRGLLPVRRVPAAVIGVGNLSVGGTGKTPLVLWLVERLQERGLRIAVVSRGYGASDARPMVVLPSDCPPPGGGSGLVCVEVGADREFRGPVEAAADEALLVALRARVPVFCNRDRAAAARQAVDWLRPDVIVLDDGFQHRRLHRDLDIVLLSADDSRAALLPAGRLREPLSALRRADVVLEAGQGMREPGVLGFAKLPAGLVRWPSETSPFREPTALSGGSVFAFAGIGQPASFFAALEGLAPRRLEKAVFADHHRYRAGDLQRIRAAAAGCDWLVTTEKDLVKLADFAREDERLVALRIDARLDGAQSLLSRLERLDARRRRQHDRSTEVRKAKG